MMTSGGKRNPANADGGAHGARRRTKGTRARLHLRDTSPNATAPGQVIDVLVSEKRDLAATRRFFTQALEHGPSPTEVTTDRAPAYPRVLDELLPAACHVTE
jgi:hypothetical protein